MCVRLRMPIQHSATQKLVYMLYYIGQLFMRTTRGKRCPTEHSARFVSMSSPTNSDATKDAVIAEDANPTLSAKTSCTQPTNSEATKDAVIAEDANPTLSAKTSCIQRLNTLPLLALIRPAQRPCHNAIFPLCPPPFVVPMDCL